MKYVRGAEIPDLQLNWLYKNQPIDLSTGYTFSCFLYDKKRKIKHQTKTTGITGAAESPNLTVAWDIDELEIPTSDYMLFVTAKRTSDDKELKQVFELRICFDGEGDPYVPSPGLYGVPGGGLEGQVLGKASDDDGDLEWINQTGGGGFSGDPFKFIVTDDEGNPTDQEWEWDKDIIVVPVPGDPEVLVKALRATEQSKLKLGTFIVPSELGVAEYMGFIGENLDGTKRVAFAIINQDTLTTPLLAGWINGLSDGFQIVISKTDNSPNIAINDDGLRLGTGETVDSIVDSLLVVDPETKLPNVKAVLDYIKNISPESFLDKTGQDWKWTIPSSPTTSDYGITTSSGDYNSTGVNRRVATPVAVNPGRLISGNMPCNFSADDGHVVLTVYADDEGEPGELLAYSDELLVDDTPGRKEFIFSGVNQFFFEEQTLVHAGFVVESNGHQFLWGINNQGEDPSYADTYSPTPDDPWNVNNNTLDPRDGHVEVYLTLEDPVVELDITAEGVVYDPTYANFVTGAGDPDNGFFVPPEDYDTVQEFVDKLVLGFASIAGISSERLHRNVPKTAHGFTAPDVTKIIRLQGGSESGSGTYVFSDCTSLENSRTDGMITGIVDVNNFNLTMEGYIGGGFTGLNGGDVLYLSDVPGEMTLTPPTTPGYVVKPVFLVVGSTRGIFLNNAPSYVIDDVIEGGSF